MALSKSVDNLCIYDVEFSFMAERFISELGEGSATHQVKTMNDLKAALNDYNAVKFLEVCLHGTPGMLYLNDKTAMVGSYINQLALNQLFLQKGARILFDSCAIGEGKRGDEFMDSIGTGMLKGKGGIVGATTVDNVVFPLFPWTGVYMKPLSFGRLKVKRYDESGKQVGEQTVDRHGIRR